MTRAALVALVAAGLFGGAWAAASLLGRAPSSPAAERQGSKPTAEFRGVELVDVDPDGTHWRVDAQEGSMWGGNNKGELEGVKVTLKKKGREVRAEAARSRFDTRDEVRFLGGVTVSWEGYRARAEEASYRRGEGRVVSKGPVVLTGPGIVVKGTGLEVDIDASRARILSRVSALVGGAPR